MLPSPDTVQAQMRKGILEFCVLAHLRRGPAYGREIAGVLSHDSRTPGTVMSARWARTA